MASMTLPSNDSSDDGKYTPTKAYMRVYAMLIEAASQRKTLVYMDVALLMGITKPGSHMSNQTGQMLGEITMREHRYGRPMISAVTVSSTGHIPGAGFYGLARQLGLLPENATKEQENTFWKAQLEAVYAEWA